MKYEVIKNIPHHKEIQYEITKELWPEFMFHDPISNKYWDKLFELFSAYQFSLKSKGEIIAIGQCLPLYWGKPFEDLPEEGWEWALQKGISSLVLKEMAAIAKEKGLENVIIPIRPSLKSLYPLIDIEDYINWERDDGTPYDPWIRVHKRFGGEIIKVCHRAMKITGTIADWERWTNLKFLQDDQYVVKGALKPINIDLDNDLGSYIEPNIWVLHRL